MRVRYPFAGAFVALVLLAAYVGLSSVQIPQANDKVLHFLTFFILTLAFYWVFDSTRRRVFNFTLLFVTVFLGLGSEALQGLATTREFDPLDIAANLIGSLCALGLCSFYHKRMLDRRRRAKGYGIVPQEGEDVELGVQETGVVEDGEDGPSQEGNSPEAGGVANDNAK